MLLAAQLLRGFWNRLRLSHSSQRLQCLASAQSATEWSVLCLVTFQVPFFSFSVTITLSSSGSCAVIICIFESCRARTREKNLSLSCVDSIVCGRCSAVAVLPTSDATSWGVFLVHCVSTGFRATGSVGAGLSMAPQRWACTQFECTECQTQAGLASGCAPPTTSPTTKPRVTLTTTNMV